MAFAARASMFRKNTGHPCLHPGFGLFQRMDENRAAPKNPREERLAKALRDNLKRRKAQARERAESADTKQRSGEIADRRG